MRIIIANNYIQEAEQRIQECAYDKADKDIEDAIYALSTSKFVQQRIGDVSQKLKNAEAERKIEAERKHVAEKYIQEAEQEIKYGEYEKAGRHINAAISSGAVSMQQRILDVSQKLNNTKAENYLKEAEQAIQQGLYDEAGKYAHKAKSATTDQKIWDAVENIHSKIAENYLKKAEQEIKENEFEKADRDLEAAISVSATSKYVWDRISDVSQKLGKAKEVAVSLEHARDTMNKGNFTEADNHLKFVLADGNDFAKKEALKLFQDLKKAKKDLIETEQYLKKVEQEIKENEFEKADRDLEAAISVSATSKYVWDRISDVSQKLGRAKAAMVSLERARDAINKGYFMDVDNNLNAVLIDGSDLDKKEALKLFKDLEKVKSVQAEKYLMEAVQEIENGQYEEAKESIKRANVLSSSQKVRKDITKVLKFFDKAKKIDFALSIADKKICQKEYGEAKRIIELAEQHGNARAKKEAARLAGELEKKQKLDLLLEQAEENVREGNYNGAEGYLTQMQDIDEHSHACMKLTNILEESPDSHLKKAVLLFKEQKIDEAREHIRKARKNSKGNIDFVRRYASLFLKHTF